MQKLSFTLFTLILFVLLAKTGSAQEKTVGLFVNDSAAFQGYTLFAPINSTTTYLIDMNGLLVHKWENNYKPSMSAYLQENGNLIRATNISSGAQKGGGFQELTWDGEVVWEYSYSKQHHDIEVLPNGNVLMVTNKIVEKADAIEAGRNPELADGKLRLLHILEVAKTDSGTSEIVWEWNTMDHLIQDFDPSKANYGIVEEHPELIDFNFADDGSADWQHTNSIDYHPQFDQIIVSNRGINEIWIIDHSTTTEEAASHSGGNYVKGGDLLYRWGNPAAYRAAAPEAQKLFAQHDACWIEPGLPGDGNILIFNNGLGRPGGAYSTIDEIVPPVDELGNYFLKPDSAFAPAEQYWIYAADNPDDFYAPRFSGAQRLPNGNTLICEGVGGTFFEVTPDNQIVWKYVNPVDGNEAVTQGDSVTHNDVGRCYRFALDFPGFAGKDLTPGEPIEKYETAIQMNNNLPDIFVLYQNFPNPFNPVTKIKYRLPVKSDVSLKIYDMTGRLVKSLVNKLQFPGSYQTQWNGQNEKGQRVSSGVYLLRLQAGDFFATKKAIILK